MNVCIIPARGGSKRIPRKNIKDFCGKPIIAYSIEAALNSHLFKRVIVSTDDNEIAEVAKKFGAEVPFLRSQENSNDFASTVDVLLEVSEEMKNGGEIYANVCCIYPTSPLLHGNILKKSFDKFIGKGFSSLIPIVKFSYPPQRALLLDSDFLKMEHPENLLKRSQDLKSLYHDAGQFYWIRTEALLEEKTLFTQECGAYELSERVVQDIDNPMDWEIAEFKYNFFKSKKDA